MEQKYIPLYEGRVICVSQDVPYTKGAATTELQRFHDIEKIAMTQLDNFDNLYGKDIDIPKKPKNIYSKTFHDLIRKIIEYVEFPDLLPQIKRLMKFVIYINVQISIYNAIVELNQGDNTRVTNVVDEMIRVSELTKSSISLLIQKNPTIIYRKINSLNEMSQKYARGIVDLHLGKVCKTQIVYDIVETSWQDFQELFFY